MLREISVIEANPQNGLDRGVSNFVILSGAEQLAGHLRSELLRKRWVGFLPGVKQLSSELGVNHKLVEAAVKVLETDGIVVGQGPRRRKKLVLPEMGVRASMRIGIILFERGDRRLDFMVETFHGLEEAGYSPFYLPLSLTEMGMSAGRLAGAVAKAEADAWVVLAGSRDILGFFAESGLPAFAFFGRRETFKMAGVGPDKLEAYRQAVRRLVEVGHCRIVLLARPHRKLPQPGASENAFLAELESLGIEVSDYHFPLWKDTKDGYQRCLKSLFQVTPPTALVVQEIGLFLSLQQFLLERGIRVPEDVSLVCADNDANLSWCEPSVAHFHIESRAWVRHILRWASKVAKGECYTRNIQSKVVFVDGGTVGPVSTRSIFLSGTDRTRD